MLDEARKIDREKVAANAFLAATIAAVCRTITQRFCKNRTH
jgi:hypothetical protein